MSEKTTDNKLPYTCTSAYDRNQSKRKERCNAYEGAYNY